MKIHIHSVLLSTLFILFSISLQAQQKQSYSTDEGKFSISFPDAFTEEIDNNESTTIGKVTCILNEQTYMATYTLHTVELDGHDELEEVSIDSFGEAINATAKSTTT